MPSHGHANLYPTTYGFPKLTCFTFAWNITFNEMFINMPWTTKMQTCNNHSSYQKFKHAFLVWSSQSLTWRSSRLRHLLRYLWYKRKICTYRKYRACTEKCSKYFSNKYDKKLDRKIKMTEKESIKNHFLFKSYKGFKPRDPSVMKQKVSKGSTE